MREVVKWQSFSRPSNRFSCCYLDGPWACCRPSSRSVSKRGYRRRELMCAVLDELVGFQYKMAVAWLIRIRNAEATDEFIDNTLPVLESYRGPDRNERLIDGMKAERSLPEDQRAGAHSAMRKPNAGLSLRQYALPLFVTQLADLAISRWNFNVPYWASAIIWTCSIRQCLTCNRSLTRPSRT
jgi:hypothetical protein